MTPKLFSKVLNSSKYISLKEQIMNNKFKLVIFIGILVLGIMLTSGFLINNKPKVQKKKEQVAVRWQYPTIGPISESLSYTGNIEAKQMVTVTPKASGTLMSLNIKVGDTTEKDSVLGQINQDAARLQLQQAQSAYNAANATYQKALRGARTSEINMAQQNVNQAAAVYKNAKDEYERIKKLYDDNIVTKSDFEKVQSKVTVYEAQYNAALSKLETVKSGARREDISMAKAQRNATLAQLKLAQLNLENTTIKSPIYGVVALVHVQEGQVLAPSIPICTITNIDSVKIKVNISEKYYSYFTENKDKITFEISPVSYPDKTFPGEIGTISPFISPENRTFWVEVFINNDNKELTAGMFCEAKAIINQKQNALLIPLETISQDNTVWIVNSDGQSAKKVKIKIGMKNDTNAEILSGITQNDKVIIEGNDYIDEKSLLKVIED